MEQQTKWKKLIKVYIISIAMIIAPSGIWIIGATHGVFINSPTEGAVYTNLYQKAIDSTEQTNLIFDFIIDNRDGYLIKYTAYIDGIGNDPILNDANWNSQLYKHYILTYNAQQFLDRYGQGEHTFTVIGYHGIPYVHPPLGLQQGDNPDNTEDIYWVDNRGYILDAVCQVSVTFTFNPPVLHYLGFWFENETQTFRLDILGFKELLLDGNAHYLHGYFSYTGSWDDTTVYSSYQALEPLEDKNDLIIIAFSTHGAFVDLKIIKLRWMLESGTTGYYSASELQGDLLRIHFDSENIFLFIECCHSEMFLDYTRDIPHTTTMCSARKDEGSYRDCQDTLWTPLNSSWSIDKKIGHITSDFLRAIAQASYAGLHLQEAFNKLEDYDYYYKINNAGTKYEKQSGHIKKGFQHPQSSEWSANLMEIYLYVN